MEMIKENSFKISTSRTDMLLCSMEIDLKSNLCSVNYLIYLMAAGLKMINCYQLSGKRM